MANPYKTPSVKQAGRAFAGALDDGAKAHTLQVARGDLGSSIKGMLANMWNSTVGTIFDGAKIPAKAYKPENVTKDIAKRAAAAKGGKETAERILGSASKTKSAIKGVGKVGIVERVASKPFRVAGKHPRLALAGAALTGLFYMNNKHNREQRVEALNQYAAQNTQPQMPQNGYYNSVTPEEYAAMQSQMRQTGGQGGFADRELARRTEQEALAAQQAPSA